MTFEQLTNLFEWLTILGIGGLLFSTEAVIWLGDLMYRLHGGLFGVDERAVSLMAYGYLGVFKLLLIVFILVSYVSMLVIS